MPENVSGNTVKATLLEDINPVNQEAAALKLGEHFSSAENDLLDAYSLKEGANRWDDRYLQVAKSLGYQTTVEEVSITKADGSTEKVKKEVVPSNFSVRAAQLIAEQRFQRASQVISMFSSFMDKIDQMKQRIIGKLSN